MLTKFLRASAQYLPYAVSFSQANGTGTSLAVTRPSNVSAGNLLIAYCHCTVTGTVSFTSTGWTSRTTSSGRTILSKTATASEASSYTFATGQSSSTIAIIILNIKNGDFDVFGSYSASSSNPSIAPSITVNSNSSLLIAIANSLNASTTFTTPTGYTSLVSYTTGPSYNIFIRNTYVTSGATGDLSITASGTSRSQLTSLKP